VLAQFGHDRVALGVGHPQVGAARWRCILPGLVHLNSPGLCRSYALYLTVQGRDKLSQVRASGTHQDGIGASLTRDERLQLTSLLRRLAAEQGITEHDFPGIPPRPR
jgi:hypothetical protein